MKDCSLKKEEKHMSKIQEKKKMAHVKCSNMGHNASMCSTKVDDQATLPKKNAKVTKRKCYGCHEKEHEIGSCPNKKSEGLSHQERGSSSRKQTTDKKRRHPTRTSTAFAMLAEVRDIRLAIVLTKTTSHQGQPKYKLARK